MEPLYEISCAWRVIFQGRRGGSESPAAGLTLLEDGKVHRLYRSWGYEDIGQSKPSPASPLLMVMIRAV